MKSSAARVFAPLALLAVVSATVAVTRAQDTPKPANRAEFMRLKLDHSKKVLSGLVNEDYDAILTGARELNRLSQAAEWEVPTIPDADEYLHFTADFQRITQDLMKSARAKNLDAATIAYTRLTINCVDCHKYVRVSKK